MQRPSLQAHRCAETMCAFHLLPFVKDSVNLACIMIVFVCEYISEQAYADIIRMT